MTTLIPKRWYVPVSFLTMIASLVVALIIGGCSSNAVSPAPDVEQQTLDWLNQTAPAGESGAQGVTILGLELCPVVFDTTITIPASPYGVQVDVVHGDEKLGFSLPYGAVKKYIELTVHITERQSPFGKFWELDCGPDGTTFNYPLYVQPNQAALNRLAAVLFYFNPQTNKWEIEARSGLFNPQVPIYHFSKYGIS